MNTRPVFVGEGESTNMLDVLPKKLTLVPIDGRFYPRTCARPAQETIFKEVQYKSFSNSEEMLELINRPKHPPTDTKDMYYILKEIIRKTWISEKFHIIGHSSGVDTRIICKAVRELTEENGEEWAGDVLYVENGGEGDLFMQIMDTLGQRGIAYNIDAEPGLYHKPFLGFKEFHEKFNGPSSYPLNQWYDCYKLLNEEGVIPKESDIQGYTGYGANETQEKAVRGGKGYAWYFAWVHSLQLSLFKHWGGDWIHPFLEMDFLHALETNVTCTTQRQRFNITLAAEMVPEINHIPHIHTREVVRKGYRHVDEKFLSDMYKTYRKSWFGSRHDVNTEAFIEYRQWWFHVYVASLCEHLIGEGYEISE